MSHILEARYIQVFWQNKNTVSKVVTSQATLELEPVGGNTVQVDIVNYSKIEGGSQGQFAIRLDGNATEPPYFLLANGSHSKLLEVKDPVTGHCWWIEGHKWDDLQTRWLSDIYRSAGQVKIKAGGTLCLVNISSSTFTHQQLESYLKDFRNDFWELILDDSSHISGEAKKSQYYQVSETTLRAVRDFITSIEHVLRKPKVELREIQRKEPLRRVRPVPRTFMELSISGQTRQLTSRAYQESFDVAENRYAHYALRRVYQICKALCTVAASQERSLVRKIEAYQLRLTGFTAIKTINKEAVLYDLNQKEQELEKFKQIIIKKNTELSLKTQENIRTKSVNSQGQRVKAFRVMPTKIAEYIIRKPYFAEVREPGIKNWFKPDDGYITVDFGAYTSLVEIGFEYEVHGEINYNIISSNRIQHHFSIISASSFSIKQSIKYSKLSNKILEDKEKIQHLEAQQWQRLLTREEDQQQNRERDSVQKMLELMQIRLENVRTVVRELTPRLSKLNEALNAFKKQKVGTDSHLPDSMTYVQNPAYQGVHRAFSLIREQAGIDDDEILMALDRIDEIGLVNISLLYERWCLLQIIKVLMFQFHFTPEPGWRQKLISQIFTQSRNISISFSNDYLYRNIVLHYEMELENGRRPDFILDVSAAYSDNKPPKTRRFVMDAKFYQDINNKRHGGLGNVLDVLINQKGYSQEGVNDVFILHPSAQSVPLRATPQPWAKNHFYGEVKLYALDLQNSGHHYGGIYLSPVEEPTYLDALQRLLGMFLQYSIEDNNIGSNEKGAMPEHKPFCLACGSADVNCKQSPRNSKAWWISCNECDHFTTYNYCFGCSKRLIKNGEYWSYHAMEPLQPLNIKCPDCGGLL